MLSKSQTQCASRSCAWLPHGHKVAALTRHSIQSWEARGEGGRHGREKLIILRLFLKEQYIEHELFQGKEERPESVELTQPSLMQSAIPQLFLGHLSLL